MNDDRDHGQLPLLRVFRSSTRVGRLLRRREKVAPGQMTLLGSHSLVAAAPVSVVAVPPPNDDRCRSPSESVGKDDANSDDDAESIQRQDNLRDMVMIGAAGGLRMPCRNELETMLPEIRATITEQALSVLRERLYPKLRARLRRRQRSEANRNALRTATRLKPSLLRTLHPLFDPWPDAALSALIERFRFEHFDGRSHIVHAGEPPASGAFIIVSGVIAVVNPVTRARRVANAPFAIGINSMLDGSSHDGTYCTLHPVDSWHICRDDFLAVFHGMLPSAAMESSIAVAFEWKNRRLLIEPSTVRVDLLRRSSIFAACPVSVLPELARFMVPYCVPPMHYLCQAGTAAHRIVFPVRGRCRVVPEGKAPFELPPHAVFGDDAVFTGAKYAESLVTITELDCFVLRKTLFDSAIRVIAAVPDALHAAFRLQRERQIDSSRSEWSHLLASPPLLGDLVPPEECVASLSLLCIPKVYGPMTVICSSGQYCSRVVVIMTGNIRIGPKEAGISRSRGSWAGFTGVVRHRWAVAAIAETLVETLEIPIELFIAWLLDHGVLQEFKSRVLRLLFPKAFPRHEADAAVALVGEYGVTGLYPVSNARTLPRAHADFIARQCPAGGATPTDGSAAYGDSSSFLGRSAITETSISPGRFSPSTLVTPTPYKRGADDGEDLQTLPVAAPRIALGPRAASPRRRPENQRASQRASASLAGMTRASAGTWVRRS